MKVNCNIDDVITFLQECKNKGFTSVELIDETRAAGWRCNEPKLTFVFSESYPNTVGIEARKNCK